MLGNILIQDEFLRDEALKMLRMADRLAQCLVECVHASEYKNGNFRALFSCIIMARSIRTLMWENSPYVCQQISGVDPRLAIILHENGYSTFSSIVALKSAEIDKVIILCELKLLMIQHFSSFL